MRILGEVKYDTFNPPRAGGFQVNRCDSAVRVTHIPTGITCESHSERGAHANREKARLMLLAMLPKEYIVEDIVDPDVLELFRLDEVVRKHDTGAPSYDGPRVDPKATPAEPAYLSPEVRIALQRQKRENFNREWPLIPPELQRRIKELERYPTAPNLSYLLGVFTGYKMATGNPSMDYTSALSHALVGKDRDPMLCDEVRHAAFSV